MMIRRIRNQLFKELEQFVRDRLGVALAFILPVIALLIIGYAIRLEAKNIALAVRDLDQTSFSRSYVERLYATNLFVPAQWKGDSLSETLRERFPDAIDRGTAQVQVTIPPDFTAEVQAGKTGNLQVVIDGSDVINARVTRLAIQGTTLSFVQAQLGKLADSVGVISQVRLWFNPGRQESLFIVPGSYGVILAIFPPLLIAIALVREKEQGTILQLYASSLSAWELLLGKSLAYTLVGLGEALILFIVGFLLFQVRVIGDPTPLIIGTPIFIWVSVQLGLIIGIFTTTQSAAVQAIGTIKVLTAFLLAGFLFPLNTVPFPFSIASYLVPVRYYIELCRDVFVRGSGWFGTWHLIGALLLLGIVEFAIAWWGMRRMQL
ncbi:ABC transporter permease [Anabaena cylindrica FACHB-243]|uniref:ABC-2 type transporter n=1 Tax=Anabaena cylindrica (strain ATCC 27899 / PCC 7122) TaxID=272123 RepID=K9ZNG0_ANACC|nr:MULTISPECIES: ABC transporter permease [Anabaena]AFZ60726.1 ABC-2 type transporter [Anabaena cylindrica PCC 7122]MBD2418383.1 ABC transporter permease [Anabaena cylindrica FACHB-243]MBY5280848.1 ABC transporter permease [Anabaena sp. CCAP 1446/1C]MBY5311045.1 ABC transporter permease [Anabaena sp. CCAP 1446/1C]MCM2408714.1 ABC transporter permease [Anabaena sp. CCAP 1446/1C]